ncbi:MAG: hypothetical protein SAK29_11045 [Scytonema sp. PMC 1069.18]|nr:hypothetical protein [Scytonema sp. PMC 1069.18]MEC4882611.1 hypothetical protein [Scytonema sp. PMC 1070.18]
MRELALIPTPGIIFTDADNVIPDVVWVSKERLCVLLNDAGYLTNTWRFCPKLKFGLKAQTR